MIPSRFVPAWLQLRNRAIGQPLEEYTLSGLPRSDWNDLVTNSRHIHAVGIACGSAVGRNGALLHRQGPAQREEVRAWGVKLYPGMEYVSLVTRARFAAFVVGNQPYAEIITYKLIRDGAEQIIAQFQPIVVGAVNQIQGAQPLVSGVNELYVTARLYPALVPYERAEFAHLSITRDWAGLGNSSPTVTVNAAGSGAYQFHLSQFNLCE